MPEEKVAAWPKNHPASTKNSLYSMDANDEFSMPPNVTRAPSLHPSAVESGVFGTHNDAAIPSRHRSFRNRPSSNRLTYSIKSIWQTKFTEDVSKDKELYIRTTLRELIIYILFLIDLCIVSFGMTSSSTFYFTNAMMSLFLDQSSPGVPTFRQSAQINDFCLFANGSMLDGLYWETWYNGENVTSGDLGYIYYANKLLGKPRLRMLRVKNSSCDVADAFTREIKECYGSYSPDIEDQSTFGSNGSFVYYTGSQLNGTIFWGQLAAYSGGGYIQELPMTKGESLSIINELIRNLWIGRGTRAVFLDFTVYNANINLFSVIKLLLEIPPTGGVIPTWSFRTVKLIRYVNLMDYIVLVFEGIFCAFVVYYIIEECIEIFKHRCSYFGSFWNCLDLLVIAISLCCIGFSIYRSLVVDAQLTQLLAEPDRYSNFEFLSFAQTRFNDAGAVLVFFAWIKIFKYISFNKTMTQLSSTLSRCSKDVGGFAIMFFIFFFAYAQLGYLLFGTQVLDYSTFYNATFTLLRIILGDFNFQALEQANRVLGPIYFITFVFFVFFILLNMFLAIINDTYGEVKSELASQKDEFQLYDYLKEHYDNFLRKLKLKKEKASDMQAVLDAQGAENIQFSEWKRQLKRRGYTDEEIATMFSRYDIDGSQSLDATETKALKMDLASETARVDMELSGSKYGTVNAEQFNNVSRRVDRIEKSLESVAEGMGLILGKLDALDQQKRLAAAGSVSHYRPTLIESQKINEVNVEPEHQKEK